MSSIEGIEQIGEQAARIDIQGPQDAEERFERHYSLTREESQGAVAMPPSDEETLFEPSAYVAVPEVDGQTTDKLVIAFSGSVAYDATDEEGAKLFNDLALGKAVELRIAGYVAAKAGGYKVTATEEEVVTGKAVVKVDTLYLLSPEHL